MHKIAKKPPAGNQITNLEIGIESSSAINLPTEQCLDCGWEKNQPRWSRFVEDSSAGIWFRCGSCLRWFDSDKWSADHLCGGM